MFVFAGFAAIGAAVGAGVGVTVATVATGIAVSAVAGAAVGGLIAAVTGGDIGQGMLYGAVGGLVTGGIFGVGIGASLSGVTGYGVETAATIQAATGVSTVAPGMTGVSTAGMKSLGGGIMQAAPEVVAGETVGGGLGVGSIVAAGIPKAIEMGFAPDPGAVTDKDKFAAEQRMNELKAQLASAEKQAAQGSNFHLAERLALQGDLYEKRAGELRTAESIRREPHTYAGRVRRGGAGSERPTPSSMGALARA